MATCPVCGSKTNAPWSAAKEHFLPLYRPGQWKYLKGNCSTFGRWSGFWSVVNLAFPWFNTLRYWRLRKATLVLSDGRPLEAAFDESGCTIRDMGKPGKQE